jgi:Tfp pilus assembly protein PilN
MDFLPPESKRQRASREKKKRFIKTAVLAGALFLVFAGLLSRGFIYRGREYKLLNAKIRETDSRVKRLKEISQQVAVVKQNLDMRGSSVDVLREIFRMVPPEVSISVLDFELQKSLVIRGVSANMSGVFKFASEIKKSKYFSEGEIKYAQKRVIKEKECVDYEISCALSRALK